MRPALLLALALVSGACDAQANRSDNRAASAPVAASGRVVDRANLIPADDEAALEVSLAAVERDAGPQFVVVTVPSLGGRSIEDFGVALGRQWGIGHARRNDGVLLIVAPNERKVRIEVGYGLEASLKDERCAEIIQRDILPRFRESDFVGGIEAGAASIIERLRASPTRDGA